MQIRSAISTPSFVFTFKSVVNMFSALSIGTLSSVKHYHSQTHVHYSYLYMWLYLFAPQLSLFYFTCLVISFASGSGDCAPRHGAFCTRNRICHWYLQLVQSHNQSERSLRLSTIRLEGQMFSINNAQRCCILWMSSFNFTSQSILLNSILLLNKSNSKIQFYTYL